MYMHCPQSPGKYLKLFTEPAANELDWMPALVTCLMELGRSPEKQGHQFVGRYLGLRR